MITRPIVLALFAARLFGAATPASKLLLASLSPFQLAGLLYLGAALGVAPAAWRHGGIRLPGRADRRNRLRLLGAVVAGGIAGPVLLLLGLRLAAAASVSLWLNFEVAATALLGVLLFRDHLGRAGWAGVAAVFAGAVLLSAGGGPAGLAGSALVLLACACWGLDNHLTALIDGITPAESTFWKGLIAGTTNLAIGLALDPLAGGALPVFPVLAGLFVGIWAYGASIVFYISAAQALGATRAQIAFATAPFFGVALSALVLGESLGLVHLTSGLLFVAGVGLLTAERHAHAHAHEAGEHEHAHRHDDGHHAHEHAREGEAPAAAAGPAEATAAGWHAHRHRHDSVVHAHPHWPDLHHRHEHG
jgi:drug/metabolite transporter (DMT)-like permease